MGLLSIFVFITLMSLVSTRETSANIFRQNRRLSNQYERNPIMRSYQNLQSRNNGNGIKISYDLVEPVTTGTLADIMTNEGIKGYAFLRSWYATGYPVQNIFVNTNGMESKYFVDQLPVPKNSGDYLVQLNVLGDKGYRIKKQMFYSTGSITSYIKDTERPEAKYAYRFVPTVTDRFSFAILLDEQGADGYRFYETNIFNRAYMVFIKDTSQTSAIAYMIEPTSKSKEEFLNKANGLGSNGFRYVGSTVIFSSPAQRAQGAAFFYEISLYYRTFEETNSRYTYEALAPAKTIDELTIQLHVTANLDLLYLGRRSFLNKETAEIYINLSQCQCDAFDLDAYY